MKALGITPRQPHTARLVDLPTPTLDEVPNGRGVLVRVLQVGVDGTDKELHLGEYGAARSGPSQALNIAWLQRWTCLFIRTL